ncbi:MAG: NUDIX hydrolase, partial [Clostridia bacterium]|nr:NUDIX hydrolase [Clostridia bacterium]
MEEIRDKYGRTEKEFLASYNPARFERPSVTVDIICLHENKVLLIKRGGHPFLGMLALPGGFLEPDEDAYAGAARELYEETLLKAKDLRMLPAFTNPKRDPRTRIVTLPFLAAVEGDPELARGSDDAADARWYFFKRETSQTARGCAIKITLTPEDGSGEETVFEALRSADETGL